MVDQALVSFGNFVLGFVALRTMPQQEFGAFFLVLSMLLFLNSLHGALVGYPLSVCGANCDSYALRRRVSDSILFTLALAPPLSLGMIGMMAWFSQTGLIPWALTAMVLWQVQETLRRGLMAHLRHREALLGDALSYIGQAAIALILAQSGKLTLEAAFCAIAITSLLGLLVQFFQLRPKLELARSAAAILHEHWYLGRWVFLTNAVALLTTQATLWTLGYFHGVIAVAEYGALTQIIGLTNPVVIGITGIVVPTVARAVSSDMPGAQRAALALGLQGAVVLSPYLAILLVAPEVAIRLVTSSSDYASLSKLLQLFALSFALAFPAMMILAVLNGLGQPHFSFAAQCAYSTTVLLVTLPLTIVYGLSGATAGNLLALSVLLVTAILLLRSVCANPPANSGAGDKTVRSVPPPAKATRMASNGATG